MREKVFFDVGANDGNSTIEYARQSPSNVVYAFEPTPRMVEIIRTKTRDLPNYHIVPSAVSDTPGRATFYVSGQADWGCSSLCSFNDNLARTWPGRTDFKVTDTVEVDVIRLDSFVAERGITEIESLHVDAQGKDMEVLIGLGDRLRIVKTGVIEMPTSHDCKLYSDQKYTADDAIAFLKENGFKINLVQSNDVQRNEVNIYFERV